MRVRSRNDRSEAGVSGIGHNCQDLMAEELHPGRDKIPKRDRGWQGFFRIHRNLPIKRGNSLLAISRRFRLAAHPGDRG